uniref:Uncharacterized protein n=1 Tax=Pinctada fucata TaxID=50426 RepID=A0A194ANS5_PINFU
MITTNQLESIKVGIAFFFFLHPNHGTNSSRVRPQTLASSQPCSVLHHSLHAPPIQKMMTSRQCLQARHKPCKPEGRG